MCGLPVNFTQWILVTHPQLNPFIQVLFALAVLSCSHPSQWPRVFIPTPPSPLFTIHSTQTYCVTTIFQTLNAETAPPPTIWTLSRWMEFSPEMTHSCNSIFSLCLQSLNTSFLPLLLWDVSPGANSGWGLPVCAFTHRNRAPSPLLPNSSLRRSCWVWCFEARAEQAISPGQCEVNNQKSHGLALLAEAHLG